MSRVRYCESCGDELEEEYSGRICGECLEEVEDYMYPNGRDDD